MNDEAALLATIWAAPDDNTPRLVFADWLQEREDPRAEYLRLDVELACLKKEGRTAPFSIMVRHRELEGTLDPSWIRAVARPTVPELIQIRDWQEFYDSLVIETRPQCGETVSKPTVVQLNQFELETGFQLPLSYREYILVFGPGRLLTDWDIAAPGYGPSRFWDLHQMHEEMRPEGAWINRHPPMHRERVCRCRYFCSKYKDTLGWDPAEVCDPEAHEYGVYRIIEDGRVVRVADSFRGFVEEAVLDMLTMPDWDEEELGPRLVFEPAYRASGEVK